MLERLVWGRDRTTSYRFSHERNRKGPSRDVRWEGRKGRGADVFTRGDSYRSVGRWGRGSVPWTGRGRERTASYHRSDEKTSHQLQSFRQLCTQVTLTGEERGHLLPLRLQGDLHRMVSFRGGGLFFLGQHKFLLKRLCVFLTIR